MNSLAEYVLFHIKHGQIWVQKFRINDFWPLNGPVVRWKGFLKPGISCRGGHTLEQCSNWKKIVRIHLKLWFVHRNKCTRSHCMVIDKDRLHNSPFLPFCRCEHLLAWRCSLQSSQIRWLHEILLYKCRQIVWNQESCGDRIRKWHVGTFPGDSCKWRRYSLLFQT